MKPMTIARIMLGILIITGWFGAWYFRTQLPLYPSWLAFAVGYSVGVIVPSLSVVLIERSSR